MKEENKGQLSARHLLFVNEMIAHGNKTQAYLAAYPGSSRKGASGNASRLLNNQLIAQAIVAGTSRAQAQVIDRVKDIQEQELDRMIEKRQLLDRIIKGELPTITETPGKDGMIKTVIQDPFAILKAIQMDEKMEKKMVKRYGHHYVGKYSTGDFFE